ncbi:MAG: hypothetical protein M0P71_01095 [Melioribacteraceae bacterium]|nr:hypothetical protein [Melioribacteraceae bacterium]
MIEMSLKDYGFLQSFTNKEITYPELSIDKIEIEDIAHSLSKICRYNGHSSVFFSVAMHSIIGMMIIDFLDSKGILPIVILKNKNFKECLKRAFLMHDAHEAYVCDLPRPIKAYLKSVGFDYGEFENKYAIKINEAFNIYITDEITKIVDEIDNLMGLIESEMLYSMKIDGGWFKGEPSDYCILIFKNYKGDLCNLFNIYLYKGLDMQYTKSLFIEEAEKLGVK